MTVYPEQLGRSSAVRLPEQLRARSPIGFAIGGVSAAGLAFNVPLGLSVVFVTMLSLGHDMTQPLLAGI